jgi:hypothetical protein
MAHLTIRVRGLSNTKADLKTAFEKKVKQVANELLVALKKNTPVRTGRAQSGWKIKINKLSAVTSNQVPYVQYLEQGTPKMRAANRGQGIIGPSLKSIKGKIK